MSGHDAIQLSAFLESNIGREALLHSLNQQRSRCTEIGLGFEELSAAVWTLLDKCQEHGDTRLAKMAMMLSQTFYRDAGLAGVSLAAPDERRRRGSYVNRDGREYLKSALIDHPLWKDMKFWDEACWQSILEQLEEGNQAPVKWHELGPDAARDAVLRVHNIVFSQIGAYAHSMVEFGCPRRQARLFVCRLSAAYQLSEDQCQMLLGLPHLLEDEDEPAIADL